MERIVGRVSCVTTLAYVWNFSTRLDCTVLFILGLLLRHARARNGRDHIDLCREGVVGNCLYKSSYQLVP